MREDVFLQTRMNSYSHNNHIRDLCRALQYMKYFQTIFSLVLGISLRQTQSKYYDPHF